jgi:hypothetical protein
MYDCPLLCLDAFDAALQILVETPIASLKLHQGSGRALRLSTLQRGSQVQLHVTYKESHNL